MRSWLRRAHIFQEAKAVCRRRGSAGNDEEVD
jgi:hypothetical protein